MISANINFPSTQPLVAQLAERRTVMVSQSNP